MDSGSQHRCHKIILIVLTIMLCLSIVGCYGNDVDTVEPTADTTTGGKNDNTTTNQSQDTAKDDDNDTSTNQSEDTTETEEIIDYTGEYYVATVESNDRVKASPYTEKRTVPDELKGIYYSSSLPGGSPRKDGEGKIWLVLKPIEKYSISKIEIEGTYSSIEDLGGDVYCICGVGSDLSISTTVKSTPVSSEQLFENSGYGISDDGNLIVTWAQTVEEPIRYVELSYTDGENSHSEYVDASTGKTEFFKMTENVSYTVTMRAVGYKHVGEPIEFESCYMAGPKDVSFPRIEITTENYVWPDCDFVQSPPEAWGAGITNALYEQCIMTVYNENNEVVYDSSSEMNENEEYLGAKMKIRGNTSARYASNGRFPYKIKLDKKFDLLEPLIGRPDDGKAYADKEWVLLNYGRYGYRVCGDAIADAVGTEWSPDYCYVGLYVNGDYRGLYVLSETVKRGNGEDDEQWRVGIDSTGYLIECDAYWWNEDFYFNTPTTKNTAMFFTFKYPDPDDFDETSESYAYIKDYVTRFEEALMRDDDSYLDYIDLDSFVKWLLVSDYLGINDAGGSNLYLYKEDSTDNTKLVMGPNWDFDSFMGNANSFAPIRDYWDGCSFYYAYLVKKASFQARYKELFNESFGKIESYINDAFSQIDEEAHLELVEYDNIRYGSSIKSISVRKTEFMSWFDEHLNWMKSQLK